MGRREAGRLVLYSVQCTLYSVHCTMYSVHCTVYNTLYRIPEPQPGGVVRSWQTCTAAGCSGVPVQDRRKVEIMQRHTLMYLSGKVENLSKISASLL